MVVVFGGYLMRRSVDESPEFVLEVKEGHKVAKVPLFDAIRRHPGAFLKIIGMRLAELVSQTLSDNISPSAWPDIRIDLRELFA
jgi:hypothetical protein